MKISRPTLYAATLALIIGCGSQRAMNGNKDLSVKTQESTQSREVYDRPRLIEKYPEPFLDPKAKKFDYLNLLPGSSSTIAADAIAGIDMGKSGYLPREPQEKFKEKMDKWGWNFIANVEGSFANSSIIGTRYSADELPEEVASRIEEVLGSVSQDSEYMVVDQSIVSDTGSERIFEEISDLLKDSIWQRPKSQE